MILDGKKKQTNQPTSRDLRLLEKKLGAGWGSWTRGMDTGWGLVLFAGWVCVQGV